MTPKSSRCACALVLAIACGCGGAATPAPTSKLDTLPKHTVTTEDRKAAACTGALAAPQALVASAERLEEHRVVRSVSIRDSADRPVEEALARELPVRVGEAYDEQHGHEAIRRIWSTGNYDDVVIDSAPMGDGVAITFRVSQKSTVDQLFVVDVPDDDLRAMHARAGGPYNPTALLSAARTLEGAYQDRGYLDAKLRVGSASAGQGRVDVCVAAKIGSLVTIGKLELVGTSHEAELRNLVTSLHGENAPGGILDRTSLDRDVLYMSAKLYDLGYVTHSLSYRTERNNDQLTIVFDVKEGGVYSLGKYEVKGDTVGPKAAYQGLLSLKRGNVFNRSRVMTDMDAIRALAKGAGRDDIEVTPVMEVDSDKHVVNVAIEIRTPPAAITSATQLRVVDLALGHGKQAKPGDRVSVHYTGSLPDGTVFDTSRTRSNPFVFVLGSGSVIKGFDQGVAGMRVGGKRRVTIPPDLGYGDKGSPPTIPPKATLVFELELMSVGAP